MIKETYSYTGGWPFLLSCEIKQDHGLPGQSARTTMRDMKAYVWPSVIKSFALSTIKTLSISFVRSDTEAYSVNRSPSLYWRTIPSRKEVYDRLSLRSEA